MQRCVAVTSELPGRAVERLEERHSVRLNRGRQLTGEDELIDFVGDADAVLTLLANPVTDRVLEACPELRVVANCAVGFDNVDLEAARRRGVWVTNTPDVLTEATADLTWALILAATRRLGEAERYLRAGRFDGWSLELLLGSGIQGRQLGIVGYGRIGRAVARRAAGFGMTVVHHSRTERADPDPPAAYLSLDELLATSWVVSLHVPLSAETRHLLDEARLRLMPRGSFLVNTARGPLVDEGALARVLADGHLGGAGLDVFENEPAVHPELLGREDVVLLPHLGSATRETRAAMAELAAANILAVLAGDDPPTPVVRP
ncbi:MAG TPA: D-glycerate dehydrogenase [Methylomirabilota bacterium]|nr:D-glycerate dehydrogenase [Methylomirabilota bacterium]